MINPKLKTLLVVNEEKNFTKAAERLSLTQPAVSHHIKELELELNTQLFIRKKGDAIPTHNGKIVIGYAKRLLALEENMRKELIETGKKSNLKIGITHTAESNKTTEAFATFLSSNKDISMTIISDSTNNLFEKIKNYELDFAIVDQKKLNNLNYLPIDTDSLVCVFNNESHLINKENISIDELKDEKLILRLPTSTTRTLFDSVLKSINESIDNFNVILELDNISTIKELVRRNVGISILAKSACMHEVMKKKLSIIPIKNLNLQRTIYFVYNDNFENIEILKEFSKIYNDIIIEQN